jgi:hypothetical protein
MWQVWCREYRVVTEATIKTLAGDISGSHIGEYEDSLLGCCAVLVELYFT